MRPIALDCTRVAGVRSRHDPHNRTTPSNRCLPNEPSASSSLGAWAADAKVRYRDQSWPGLRSVVPGSTRRSRPAGPGGAAACRPARPWVRIGRGSGCERRTPRSWRIVACRTLARKAVGHRLARSVRHSTAGSKTAWCSRHLTLHQYLTLSQKLLRHPNAKVALRQQFPPFLPERPAWQPYPPDPDDPRGGGPDDPGRPGRERGLGGRDALPDPARVHRQHGATAAGDGAGRHSTRRRPRPPRPRSSSRPSTRSRSARSGSIRCREARSGSSSTARLTNTELTINPLPQPIRKGYAHSFAYGAGGKDHLLNIGQITVNSGSIGAIEGFHTADLSGPLIAIGARRPIDRIAFNSIQPGASITTGGSAEHARRASGHHPEHRDEHPDRPRPQPAQCRSGHRPLQWVADSDRPRPWRGPPASQGDRYREQCPDPLPEHCCEQRQRHTSARGRHLHSGRT